MDLFLVHFSFTTAQKQNHLELVQAMDGIGVISLITSCTCSARLAVRFCALCSCHTESKWQLNDLIWSKVILVECEHVTVDVAQRARLLLETEIHLMMLIKMVLNNKTISKMLFIAISFGYMM